MDWLLKPFEDEAKVMIDFILNEEKGKIGKLKKAELEQKVAKIFANAHDDATVLIERSIN